MTPARTNSSKLGKTPSSSTNVFQIRQRPQPDAAEVRDFIENAVVPMHWMAPDGTILWANRAELDMLGYTAEEYVGHNIADFHVDAASGKDIVERLEQREELRGLKAALRCKDGGTRIVRIYSHPYVKEGELVHTRSMSVYVAEREQSDQIAERQEAEISRDRLAAIVESSDDAIVSKDLRGIVTSWNKAAERIFGYTADEIVGQPITTIIPPELQGDEPEILARIQSGQRIEHFETVRLTKSGERIDVALTISPVKDKTGKITGAAKIARDITKQKKMEMALSTSERLASVGRLAATVAHEINNPLEAVTNYIYLAKQNPDVPEKIHRYLASADRELSRVAHIAQQTLGFYRDNSHPVMLDIPQVINDVLTIYERKFAYKELKVERDFEENLNARGLQGELKQILSNLIANAIDASEDGGKIIIRARCFSFPGQRRGIRITVADSGVGIREDVKSRIFAPFFTTKKEVGTGLGLWVTRDILEKRGGSIRFRSRSSQPSGTVMSVFLPSTSALAARSA